MSAISTIKTILTMSAVAVKAISLAIDLYKDYQFKKESYERKRQNLISGSEDFTYVPRVEKMVSGQPSFSGKPSHTPPPLPLAQGNKKPELRDLNAEFPSAMFTQIIHKTNGEGVHVKTHSDPMTRQVMQKIRINRRVSIHHSTKTNETAISVENSGPDF